VPDRSFDRTRGSERAEVLHHDHRAGIVER
jgi:hypothetical protein